MTQTNKILKYLRTGKTLTPIKALKLFGCFRLGARIYDLHKLGYKIIDISKRRWSEYKLIGGRV